MVPRASRILGNRRDFRLKILEALLLLILLSAGAWFHFDAALQGPPTLPGNEAEYYDPGVGLARRWTYSEANGRPLAFRCILYPSFIAGISFFSTPMSPLKARLALAALGCLAIIIVWQTGRLIGGQAVGLLAAGFTALNPWMAEQSGSLYIAGFLTFLVIPFIAWSLMLWLRGEIKTEWLALSLSAGLLCRSVFLPLPFLLAAVYRGQLKGRAWKFLLLCFLPLLPWILRNYRHFQEFIPFERQAAIVNIYDATRGLLNPPLLDDSFKNVETLRPELAGQSNEVRLKAMQAMALDNIRRSPLRYLFSCLQRLWRAFFLLADGAGWLLFLLAGAGLWLRRKNRAVTALGFLAAAYIAPHPLATVQPRYVAPVTTLLCLLAAVGVSEIIQKTRGFKKWIAPHFGGASGNFRWLYYSAGIPFAALILLSAVFCFTDVIAGKTERALPLCSAGAKDSSDKGVALFLKGNNAGAQEEFRAAIQRDPACVEALLNMAAIFYAGGRDQEALSFFNEAVAVLRRQGTTSSSVLAEALSGRSEIQIKLGRREAALEDLNQSLRAAPYGWPRKEEISKRIRKLSEAL